MARISFLLSLTTWLLTLLSPTLAVEIYEIFTVADQVRTSDGGCGDRMQVLDQWLSEDIESVDVAMNAIDEYRQRAAVRRTMTKFFGIKNDPQKPNDNAIRNVRTHIEQVRDFFNLQRDSNGQPFYDMNQNWLFCHCNFLVWHEETDPALDFQGNIILDKDGNQVSIMDVKAYRDRLKKDSSAIPWWAGDLTQTNGYYFTDTGADFCDGTDLGLTATLEILKRGADGKAVRDRDINSVILCPYSFDGSPQPNSYRDANNLLAEGTNLADAVPKSATLLHEMFHVINGGYFLAGKNEKYDIAECIELSNSPNKAQQNPESYVFFIAHMYHLYGEKDKSDPNAPWSIGKNWNFEFQGRGDNRVFGATQKGK